MKTLLVRPILVESKEKTKLLINSINKRLLLDCEDVIIINAKYQQPILISLDDKEKIEIGDNAISDDGYLIKVKSINGNELSFIPLQSDVYCNKETFHPISRYNKVIATQDQLSPELINQLVAEYNNGGMQDFEIEQDGDYDEHYEGYYAETVKPKVTNGFVTVVEKPNVDIHLNHDPFWDNPTQPESGYHIRKVNTPTVYTEQDLQDAFNAGGQYYLMNETNYPKNALSFEEFLKNKKK